MASSSKKRTTMAKLARENKLRERRAEKKARKDARKDLAADTRPDGVESSPALSDLGPAAAEPASETTET